MTKDIKVILKQNSTAEITINGQPISHMLRRIEIVGEVGKPSSVVMEFIAVDITFEGASVIEEYLV